MQLPPAPSPHPPTARAGPLANRPRTAPIASHQRAAGSLPNSWSLRIPRFSCALPTPALADGLSELATWCSFGLSGRWGGGEQHVNHLVDDLAHQCAVVLAQRFLRFDHFFCRVENGRVRHSARLGG